jgi:Flp pilus assembly protein TadG
MFWVQNGKWLGEFEKAASPLFLCLKNRKYLMKILRKLLTAWVKREEGTTAIEFALMAFPFLFLVLAIIEVSVMYAGATLLEGSTEAAFRAALCDYATVLIRCDDFIIEVQPMTNFTDYSSMQPQYDEDGNMVSTGFNAGGSESKMLVRVAYRYTMLNPFVGVLLLGPTNSRLFMSTIVLQTEPYEFDGT